MYSIVIHDLSKNVERQQLFLLFSGSVIRTACDFGIASLVVKDL